MAELKAVSKENLGACAKIYCEAYAKEPWNEEISLISAEKYIADFLDSKAMCAFGLSENDNIIGIALGMVVPCVEKPFFRLEDFCIAPEYQKKGFGGAFLKLIENEISPCNSIILGTQRNFPSHRFYLENGFYEVDSVLLYKEI